MASNRPVRTTLYRVTSVEHLTEAIREKYQTSDLFDHEPVEVAERTALLISGHMKSERANWNARLARLSGIEVVEGNTAAAALLIIRDEALSAWCLSYGMGFQLLEPAKIDPGFGIRIATRCTDPEALRSLTRTALDHSARTDRSSIPAGEALRSFGVREFGEFVTRLSGTATIPGLKAGSKSFTIRGADALSLPLSQNPGDLVADLDVLRDVLKREPLNGLASLEQLVRVKHPGLLETLNEQLAESIRQPDPSKIALGWPHERIDSNGTPSSYRILGAGTRAVGDDIPSFSVVRDALLRRDQADPVGAAQKVKIQLFRDSDGEDAISSMIPALRWLMFEVEVGGTRYCLFDGSWYAMDQGYSARLQARVNEIFERPLLETLPVWDSTLHEHEADYNKHLANELGGVMMDGVLVRTEDRSQGFEACDVVAPSGALVHVKRTDSSGPASHLISQAIVSTDALLFDETARIEFRGLVRDAGGSPGWVDDRPSAVILGMARNNKRMTAESLFSFTQVTLVRLDDLLTQSGVSLQIAAIERHVPVLDGG